MWYNNKLQIFILSFLLFLLPNIFAFKESYYTYVEGLIDVQKGKYKEAIEKFELTLQQDPQAVEVYKQLFYLYVLTGETEKLKWLSPKILDTVDEIQMLLYIGNLFTLYGEKDFAEQFFKKVLTIDPENKDAVLGLAQTSFPSDTKKSVDLLSQYLELVPEDVDAMFQSAIAEYKLGNIDTAIELFKKIVNLQTDNETAKLVLAELLSMTSDYMEAEKIYSLHLEKNPDDYQVISKAVILLLSKEKLDIAEKYVEKLKLIPEKEIIPENFYLISVFYELKKDFNSAIKYMEKFIKTEKKITSVPYAKLGFYYSRIKKYNQAEKWLKYGIKKFNNINTKVMLAFLYLDIKKYNKAIKVLSDIKTNPQEFRQVFFYLGYCYDQMGKFEVAEKYFLESISKYPDDHESLNYLGYSYVDKGINLELAEKYIKKALELQPDNAAYIDSYGWLCFKLGKYEEAEKELVRAAEKIQDAIIFDHVGDVKLKLGKKDEAIEFYKKALQIDSKNKKIRNKLSKIKN